MTKMLEPTFARIVPLLVATIQSGEKEQGAIALAELQNMAEAADLYNELVTEQEKDPVNWERPVYVPPTLVGSQFTVTGGWGSKPRTYHYGSTLDGLLRAVHEGKGEVALLIAELHKALDAAWVKPPQHVDPATMPSPPPPPMPSRPPTPVPFPALLTREASDTIKETMHQRLAQTGFQGNITVTGAREVVTNVLEAYTL